MADLFKSKLFEGMTEQQKLELIVKALGQTIQAIVLATAMLSEVADRLDEAVKRFEQKSWEKAINARLEERKKDGTSVR